MSAPLRPPWPAVLQCERLHGEVRLSGVLQLLASGGAAEWADAFLVRTDWLRLRPSDGDPAAGILRLEEDPDLAEEEFLLAAESDRGVLIRAGSLLGAGHAAVVLRQLLPPDAHRRAPIDRASWVVPAVRIHDRPALAWRGFMLDVSRHFVPKDELLTIIDRLGLHRLNRLHLHLTDDQGWRVESRAFPAINDIATWRRETGIGTVPLDGSAQSLDGTPHGGYYTLDDLREITAHARARGIVIVPEIDLPAHASAVIAAVPQLRVAGAPVLGVASTWGDSGRAVNPMPEGREALAVLLEELAGAVDSPYLHIGGDETLLGDWEASSEIRQYIADSGLGSVDALRADLTGYLAGRVTGMGRQPVVWEEAFLDGGLPHDALVMAWRAEAPGLAAMAAGHDVVMAPIDGSYLDYADTPEDGLAIGYGQDIARVARYVPSRGDGPGRLLGTQAALWTEYVPDARTRAARMFPRLSVHAANAWTGAATPWPAARVSLEAQLDRLTAAGVEYRPLDAPLPWQRGGTGRRRPTSKLTLDLAAAVAQAVVEGYPAPTLAQLMDPQPWLAAWEQRRRP